MADILKGNFEVARPPKAEGLEQDLTDRFEREALKRLGGSIAFVSKKKFLYGAETRRKDEPSPLGRPVPDPEPEDRT